MQPSSTRHNAVSFRVNSITLSGTCTFPEIFILQRDIQESNHAVLSRKHISCIIEFPQKRCAWMNFPLWSLSIALPIMKPVNAGATSRSCSGADSSMSPAGNSQFSFLTGKPICVSPPSLLNVEQCPGGDMQAGEHACCA